MDKLVGFARKKRLGDLLVDAGVISQDQLVKALQVQKTEKQGERLGVVLIDLGFTDEKQIVEALKAQLKIQSVDLSTLRIPEEIIRLLWERQPDRRSVQQYTNRYLWHVDEKLPGRKEKRKSVVSGWLQTGDSDKGCGNSVGCVRGTAVVSHRN